ncbi:hypothetical protein RND71_030725 [Anisodus tanguticus]|uniref:Uncharacterized protein n=1 Tax=Anisodus tanguticus TaxID=243964 RepID=A0AAE1V1A1_9SOLA|nr:hypothetical protein RND71_030725 [Anisodus tanguticus]
MQAMVTNSSSMVEILSNLTNVIDGWDKYMQNQHARIDNPRKESPKQPITQSMVRRPRKQKLVDHPKKTKVKVDHYQKPRRPMTSEEFLPSWFYNRAD